MTTLVAWLPPLPRLSEVVPGVAVWMPRALTTSVPELMVVVPV